jgi:hypothetical protein
MKARTVEGKAIINGAFNMGVSRDYLLAQAIRNISEKDD